MAKRIKIVIGGVTAEAALLEDQAPKTAAAFWEVVPFVDRTVHVAWSGFAWRTYMDYPLLPKPTERVADRLGAGDIIYFPGGKKIGFCYGKARWYNPFAEEIEVTVIGKIDKNLDEFVRVSSRIMYDGPLTFWVSRLA